MFLKVLLFAVSLSSIRAEVDDCEELLKPRDDQYMPPGKYIVLAVGSSNDIIAGHLKRVKSSWIEISTLTEEVTVAEKMGDQCFYRNGIDFVWNKVVTVILKSSRLSTMHKGSYLDCPDKNALMWLDRTVYQQGNHFMESENIVLLKKNENVTMTNEANNCFKKLAKCRNMDFHMLSSPHDLCDEEKSETEPTVSP